MLIEATLIGVLIGIVVGALGAGGGILSVPVLVYLLGQNPHQAATLSLIIVGATACVSLITRASSGHVDWKQGSLFAFAGIVGTWGILTLACVDAQEGSLSGSFSQRDRFSHRFLWCGRRFRYRSCASPCPALPDEESISDISVDHAHHSAFRLGFARAGGNFGYQRRGRDDGRLLRCGLDVRRHPRGKAYPSGKFYRTRMGVYCSPDRSCKRECLRHATRITKSQGNNRYRRVCSRPRAQF